MPNIGAGEKASRRMTIEPGRAGTGSA